MKNLLGYAVAGLMSLALMVTSPVSAQQPPLDKPKGGKVQSNKPQQQVQQPQGPQNQQGQKHRSNTGRNVAVGVAAGVVGAIILNETARASNRGSVEVYENDDGPRHLSCRQLERRCDDGQDWACRRYDRRGC